MTDLSMFSEESISQSGTDLSMFSGVSKLEESILGSAGHMLASTYLIPVVGVLKILRKANQELRESHLAELSPEERATFEQKHGASQPFLDSQIQLYSQTAKLQEEQAAQQLPEGFVGQTAAKVLSGVGSLPLYALASHAAGAVAGFATLGALETAGQEGASGWDVGKSATLNAGFGKVLQWGDRFSGGALKRGVKMGGLFGTSSVVGQLLSDPKAILTKEGLSDTAAAYLIGMFTGGLTKPNTITGQKDTGKTETDKFLESFTPPVIGEELGLKYPWHLKSKDLDSLGKLADLKPDQLVKATKQFEKSSKNTERLITSGILQRSATGQLELAEGIEITNARKTLLEKARKTETFVDFLKSPEKIEAVREAKKIFQSEEDMWQGASREKVQQDYWTNQEKQLYEQSLIAGLPKESNIELFQPEIKTHINNVSKLSEEQLVAEAVNNIKNLDSVSAKQKGFFYDTFIAPLKDQGGFLYIAEKDPKTKGAFSLWLPAFSEVYKNFTPKELDLVRNLNFVRVSTSDWKSFLPNTQEYQLEISGADFKTKVLNTKALDYFSIKNLPLPSVIIKASPKLETEGTYFPRRNVIEAVGSAETISKTIFHELSHWANMNRPEVISPQTAYLLKRYPISKFDTARQKFESMFSTLNTFPEIKQLQKNTNSSMIELVDSLLAKKEQISSPNLLAKLYEYKRLYKIVVDLPELRHTSELMATEAEHTRYIRQSAVEERQPFERLLPYIEKEYKASFTYDEVIPLNTLDFRFTPDRVLTNKPKTSAKESVTEEAKKKIDKILGFKPENYEALWKEAHEKLGQVSWVRKFLHGMRDTKGDMSGSWYLQLYSKIRTQPDIAKSHPQYREFVDKLGQELFHGSYLFEEQKSWIQPLLRSSLSEQKEASKLVLFGEKIKDPQAAKSFIAKASKISPEFNTYIKTIRNSAKLVSELLQKELQGAPKEQQESILKVIGALNQDLVYFPHIWFSKFGNLSKNELYAPKWNWFSKPLAVLDNLKRGGTVVDLTKPLAKEGGVNFGVVDFAMRLQDTLVLNRLSKQYPHMKEFLDSIAKQTEENYVQTWKHLKERRGVQGYNTDVIRVMAEYLSTLNQVYTRSTYLPQQMKALAEIDPQSYLFKHARNTMQYHIGRKAFESRKLDQALFFMFLTKPVTAVAQALQAWSVAAPYLSMLARDFPAKAGESKSGSWMMAKASKDWAAKQVLNKERLTDMAVFLRNLDKDLVGKKTFLTLAAEGVGRLSEASVSMVNKAVGKKEMGWLHAGNLFGYTKATFTPELLGIRGGALHRQVTPRFERLMSFMFRNLEIYSKEVTFLSAMKILTRAGVSEGDAIHLAGQFTTNVLAEYSGIFKPAVARNLGNIPLKFGLNPIMVGQHLKNLLAKSEFKAFVKIIAGTIAQGGIVAGIPGYFIWQAIYGKKTGRDLKTDISEVAGQVGKAIHPQAGQTFEDFAHGGLPELLFGVDVSNQVQILDIPILRSGDIYGVLGNMVDRYRQAVDYADVKDWLRFSESVSPEVLRIPLTGIRMKMYGINSPKGMPLGAPSEAGEPITDADFYKLLLSFTPSTVKKVSDFERYVKTHKAYKAAAKTTILTKLINSYKAEDDKKLEAALTELEEWNNSVRPEDMISITMQDVKRRITQPHQAFRYFLEESLNSIEEQDD